MKPPIEYRQPRPASSSGRTPDFGKGGLNPSAGTKLTLKGVEIVPDVLGATDGGGASFALAHKKAVKAAQMRRYRAGIKARRTK